MKLRIIGGTLAATVLALSLLPKNQTAQHIEPPKPVQAAMVREFDEPISPYPSTTKSGSLIVCENGNVYTDEIPMSYGYQAVMQDACRKYNVPYALALGMAEVESGFDFDAWSGWAWGIMQINPINYDSLRERGIDPETKSGNITAGVYMIGALMDYYGDPHKALIAYNCGEAGARELWAEGYENSQYSRDVTAAAKRWQDIIN